MSNRNHYEFPQYRQPVRRVNLSTPFAFENDLGDGFKSYKWTLGINSNEFLLVFMNAPGMKVINGGFAPAKYTAIYAMESFPRQIDQWVMTIYNTSPEAMEITFYLIAKK